MRSRSASAAALYQSWRVAIAASLPIASVSLASIALLISASASSSTGALSGGYFAGCDWSGNSSSPGITPDGIIRGLSWDRNPPQAALVRCNAWLLCKDRAASAHLRGAAIAAMMASGEAGPGEFSRQFNGARHETDHRNRRCSAIAVLHHRHQRRLRSRQARPQRRRPELLVQRRQKRLAPGALRRDPP